MKRILIAVALLLSSVVPARGQGTPMPNPLIQWFTNAGAVFSDGGLCVFVAGTSTLATTYTTAALSVANSNPIEFNSAGRAATGVFLTPGSAYKFVLKDFAGVTSPTCVPDTGVTIWTVDNVDAVPTSANAIDAANQTAGESIAAGDAVYLSTGAGGTNAGQWYRTDADAVATSTGAFVIGMAPSAINSGAQGLIRVAGLVTPASALTPGANYYLSGTPGAITSTAPANGRYIGQAISATSFLIDPSQATYSKLITSSTAADSLDVGGGINAGTGNVGIVDATGKIPALNSTYLTSTSGAGITGIPILLHANSGSTTNAAAENVDTYALASQLTAKDRLLVYFAVQSVTQPTAAVLLQNSTDGVKVIDVWDSGAGALPAGRSLSGSVILQQFQVGATSVGAVNTYGTNVPSGQTLGNVSAFVTNWTGAWTLALRQTGVTAGGTFRWSWAIYRVQGQ